MKKPRTMDDLTKEERRLIMQPLETKKLGGSWYLVKFYRLTPEGEVEFVQERRRTNHPETIRQKPKPVMRKTEDKSETKRAYQTKLFELQRRFGLGNHSSRMIDED